MNNRHIIILTLVLQLVALLLGSCSDRLGIDSDAGGNDRVRFTPVISEMNDLTPTADTRAMAAKHVVRLSHTEGIPQLYLHIEPMLEMCGSRLQGDGTRAIYTTNNTISKLYFTLFREKDPAGKPFVEKGLTTKEDNWITGTEWPHGSGQKFKVYSVSPYEPSFTDPTIGSVDNASQVDYNHPPIVSYTMPDIDKQEDIVYAESDPLDPEASHAITMNYRHIFSGLALAEGRMINGLKLTKVEIKGLYAKGTCTLSKSDIAWAVDNTVTKDFTITKDYTTVGQNSALITPTDRDELMVIPQTTPAGATVTVTFVLPNGTEKKLTASIAGMEFKRGVVHWLLISTRALNWKYTLNVTQSEINTPYNGGSVNLYVNSLRTSVNGEGTATTQEAIPFKVEYSTDDGTTWTDTKPAWLTSVPTFTAGNLSNETSVASSAQTAVTKTHSSNLQNKSAVTDYDLSLYDVNGKEIIGGSSTANCYVIHGPGTYRIPCVYGNTLKLGQYNGYAVDYLNQSGQGGAFVDYTGTRISGSNYQFSPSTADVLWQSTDGAVTNLAVTKGNDGMSYVTFTVNKDGLQQGNAVIAASNASGTVMWSWHLWITDATLTAPNYDFLTQNLGWVSSSDSYNHYPARSVQLRISQTNPLSDANPVVLTVNQTEGNVDSNPSSGSCLYYQWGRKDPFQGSDIEKNSALITEQNQAPLYLSIQNPTQPILYYYYYSSYYNDCYDWTSDHYNVLWNARYSAQQVNTPVEKSVYDPSPYGFRAPKGPKTFNEIFASLPNMGYYRLDVSENSGYGYDITVSPSSTKYYWTTRGDNSTSPWVGYVVSSSGYNGTERCSSLLPMRPYSDSDSGKPLQQNN